MAEANEALALPDPVEDAGSSRKLLYALQECLRSALSAIQSHRLRSFLTMLGVIIGVASVICVIALVQGMSSSISDQFTGLGSTTLTLRAETPIAEQMRGNQNRLRFSDVDELRYRIEGIAHITPAVPVSLGQVTYGSHTAAGQFYGTTESAQDVQGIYPRSGRFITRSDDDSRRRVVVLGEQIRKDLDLPEKPEGEYVQIGQEWFKVVGVMEPRGEVFGFSQDGFLMMPYQTALAFNSAVARPDFYVSFTVNDPDMVDNVKQRVAALIRRAHGIEEGKPDDFTVQSSDTFLKTFKQITGTITAVGGRRGWHLAAGRGHRHHEHHAGVSD